MAIAYDTSAKNSAASGSSLNISHPSGSGSDTIGFVTAFSQSGDNVTGVTWGGNAMTLVDKSERSGRYVYLYYIVNPGNGAATVTISRSVSTQVIWGMSERFTGAAQTSPIESSNTYSIGGAEGTLSFTVASSGAWMVGGSMGISTTVFTSVNVGVARQEYDDVSGSSVSGAMADSNAVVPAGAYSMTFTYDQGGGAGVGAIFKQAGEEFTVSDTVSLSETVTASRTRLFSILDSSTVTDVATAFRGFSFAVMDALSVTDAATALRARLFSALETVVVTDAATLLKKWLNLAKNLVSTSSVSKSNVDWTNTPKS